MLCEQKGQITTIDIATRATGIIAFWPRTSIEAFLAEFTKGQQFLPNGIIWGEYY